MNNKITVIDFGAGNLHSVQYALEHCGAEISITSNKNEILAATKLVLPGTGAFRMGMDHLVSMGLDNAIKKAATNGVPIFGICLGMQMLLDQSEEFGITEGLGLISGKAVAIPNSIKQGHTIRVPHVGWEKIEAEENREAIDWPCCINNSLGYAYFVHTYMAQLPDESALINYCMYEGVKIPAMIAKDNIAGSQFHPEKSGEFGLSILKNFILL